MTAQAAGRQPQPESPGSEEFPVLCPAPGLYVRDVPVIGTSAADEYSYWGEILSEAAATRGLAGRSIYRRGGPDSIMNQRAR